jgi:hypothetical protein
MSYRRSRLYMTSSYLPTSELGRIVGRITPILATSLRRGHWTTKLFAKGHNVV